MTSCTRPSGFKPASELTSLSGDSYDDDTTTYPGAPEICGDNRDNNQNGQTDETCCNVSVSVYPNAVWPQSAGSTQTTATITVSLINSAPSEGCTVNLSVEPVNLSGGHNHGGTRPKGKITDSSGNVRSSLILNNTESSVMLKYTSSEVSGEEKITAKLDEKIISETTIRVRVPGLEGMPQSGIGAWRLTGSYGEAGVISQHFENHYGTPSTKARIGAMARDYFEVTGVAIGINDMSLELGGLFDIYK